MEAGPDARVCDLFGHGSHVGEMMDYTRQRRVGQGDLGEILGSENRLHDTGYGPALDTMRARVFRVHWRGADWLPGCVTISGRVAINVTVANGSDRSPEVVLVLGVQYRNDGVVQANGRERHEARAVHDIHLFCCRELTQEGLIAGQRVDPEPGSLGLLACSLRAVLSAVVLAQSSLSSETGGAGRNWDPAVMANGFMSGHIEDSVIAVGT